MLIHWFATSSKDGTVRPQKVDVTAGKEWDMARKVIDQMEKRHILPSPENYATWFFHLTASIPPLSNEIRQREAEHKPFDEAFTSYLFQQYVMRQQDDGQDAQKELVNNTQDMLADALSVITSLISEADSKNANIQERLHDIIEDKEKLDINTLVEALVRMAREMNRSSLAMRNTLEDSRKEVQGLKENLQAVSQEAERDFLTGVCNRKSLETRGKRLITTSRQEESPLSLIIADVDHFKQFNDNYGHLVGDEVLKMVAKMLTDSVKGQDVVARFGGEEFVLLLPATPLEGASAVAENIRSLVARKGLFNRESRENYGAVTISAGVAALTPEDKTLDELIERADRALYQAKEAGRNRVIVAGT